MIIFLTNIYVLYGFRNRKIYTYSTTSTDHKIDVNLPWECHYVLKIPLNYPFLFLVVFMGVPSAYENAIYMHYHAINSFEWYSYCHCNVFKYVNDHKLMGWHLVLYFMGIQSFGLYPQLMTIELSFITDCIVSWPWKRWLLNLTIIKLYSMAMKRPLCQYIRWLIIFNLLIVFKRFDTTAPVNA